MSKKFNCILLIDDDVATNELHELIIEESDIAHEIHITSSGKEALDYLTNSGKYKINGTAFPKPDLILLDINMPAMNGFEFINKYEKLDVSQKGKIVIVMLTSSLNPDDEEKATQIATINGFRNKPLTVEMLRELGRTYLLS